MGVVGRRESGQADGTREMGRKCWGQCWLGSIAQAIGNMVVVAIDKILLLAGQKKTKMLLGKCELPVAIVVTSEVGAGLK